MMKFGTIKCPCGKEFYFESVSDVIECVYCGCVHDVIEFPVKEEIVEEEQTTEEAE